MTAVRSVDSFKYGTRLFAYLFVILLVGGGLLGLGALIIENANTSLSNGVTGIPDKTELAGGAILALIGGFVFLSGLFGIVHKLIADGVEAGRATDEATATAAADSAADADSSATDDGTPSKTGPSPGEQAARDHGDAPTVPSEATAEPPETPEPPEPEPPAEPESPPESASADAESPESQTAAPAGGEDSANEPTADSSESKSTVESEPPEDPRPPEPDPQVSESADAEPTESTQSAPSPSAEDDRSATERAIDEGFGTRDESRDSADEPTATGPVETGDAPGASESDPETAGFETHESVGESDPRPDDPDTAPESAEPLDDRPDQSPPEPSPEEIAFGTTPDDEGESDDEDEEPTATVDEDDDDDDDDSGTLDPFEELDEESSSVDPAGNPSAGDPLADPTDDE